MCFGKEVNLTLFSLGEASKPQCFLLGHSGSRLSTNEVFSFVSVPRTPMKGSAVWGGWVPFYFSC